MTAEATTASATGFRHFHDQLDQFVHIHWDHITGGILLVVVVSFYLFLFKSLRHANEMLMPHLIEIEQSGPR